MRNRQDHAGAPRREASDGEVKFAAFTGKAAPVMRSKGATTPHDSFADLSRARIRVEQPSF